MHHGLALVAAVLESRDYLEAIRCGARPELLDDEAGVYWDLISDHHERFHEVPTLEHFSSLAPGYDHNPSGDSVDAIVHELKTIKLGGEIDGGLTSIAEKNAIDPWEAKSLLVKIADRVNVSNQDGANDYVVGADKDRTLRLVERLREGAGLLGYRWPWEHFNNETWGICPGNVIYFYGRQKSRKTWILLCIALYLVRMGLRVLFFTSEMTIEEIELRALAMEAQLDWSDFTGGKVSDEDLAALEEVIDELYKSGKFIITDVSGEIDAYKAKVEEYNPDVVIHDYFKALADAAAAQSRSLSKQHLFVARAVDQLCDYHKKKLKKPLIMCGHANREGDKSRGKSSTEHAWSDHITRRVDLALRVIANDAEDKIAIIVNEGRNVRRGLAMTINGKLCQDFGVQLDTKADWVEGYEQAEEESEESKKRNGVKHPQAEKSSIHRGGFRPGDFKRRRAAMKVR